jgi:hypothetical protein
MALAESAIVCLLVLGVAVLIGQAWTGVHVVMMVVASQRREVHPDEGPESAVSTPQRDAVMLGAEGGSAVPRLHHELA